MAEFFAELKRRHIYRVGAAYLVVAWTLAQFIGVLWQVFDFAPWIAQLVFILLALGFPVALTIAWTIESKPQQAIASAVRARNTTVDWALFGALGIVILLIGYQQFAPSAVPAPQPGVDVAREAAASPATAISVAVLPFSNLSGDPSQEFFSDGVSEEITSVLAKIPDLRVVGRTSAFQFKGQNQDLRAIGQALAATHLLEGSVRREGNRLRITAQLIEASNGVHLWTESYDRELTSVFAIQEEIAAAIAGALKTPLGLRPGETLVAYRPADQETYELFLRARAAVRSRNYAEALPLTQQVVARDPNFGPGWVWLARARGITAANRVVTGDSAKRPPELESNETLARRAIALAPNYAGSYAMLAGLAAHDRNWREAIDLYKQALARDPDDPEVLFQYGSYLRALGYLKEALAAHDRMQLVEPLVRTYRIFRAQTLGSTGMTETALNDFLRQGDGRGEGDYQVVAVAYARMGRFNEAADALSYGGPRTPLTSGPCAQPVFDAAAGVLRAAATKSEPPAPLPDFRCDLGFVYAYTNTPERALEEPEALERRGLGGTRDVWWYTPSSLRKTERFKQLVRNAGLVDIWRVRGWPDLCRPLGADDFECE